MSIYMAIAAFSQNLIKLQVTRHYDEIPESFVANGRAANCNRSQLTSTRRIRQSSDCELSTSFTSGMPSRSDGHPAS